jgi:hypothetical protein
MGAAVGHANPLPLATLPPPLPPPAAVICASALAAGA